MPARALAAGALLAALGWVAAPAFAAGDLVVDHAQSGPDGLQVLVTPPAGATPDLEDVTVTIDGTDASAEAASATGSAIRRTTVLALDTNQALEGPRQDAMTAAVDAWLDAVPEDVYVGVVSFDDEVSTLLEPTLDRDAAHGAVAGLTTAEGSRVYDGTVAAADLATAEDDGAAQVIVVAASADTGRTLVQEAANELGEDVRVDVLSLGQKGASLEGLTTLAEAGHGDVVSTDVAGLGAALATEAAAQQSQVAVTVQVPDSVTRSEGSVDVTLGSDQGALSGSVFAPLGQATSGGDESTTTDSGLSLPSWAQFAIVGVMALGFALLVLALLPSRKKKLQAADVITQYTDTAGRGHVSVAEMQSREDTFAGAKDMARQVLERNRGLEERIAKRLDAAGSELKASEWLLIHAGVVVLATLLGILLGGGNLLVGLIFMAVGALLPWLYLGFRRSRRRKAFSATLPDVLQLMAGSLQAGLSLPQAVDTIVREGTEPISTEFKRVLVETRLGVDLEDAFQGVADRYESKDFAWVVMAITIQRQVGGNLAELLNTVAGTMREREYMRRQVAALAAEGKLSAYVLGGLPPVFLLYLVLVNRDYVMPLFTTPLGLLMLGGAAVLLAVGAFWMSRLVKVEV